MNTKKFTPNITLQNVANVITPEMVAAGVKIAWSAPEAPRIVEDLVKRIYLAMEAARKD